METIDARYARDRLGEEGAPYDRSGRSISDGTRWLAAGAFWIAALGLGCATLRPESAVAVVNTSVRSIAPNALPLLVTQKWLQTGDHPLLADFFVQHLWLAWPVHLLVIYIELFALVAVFRPELHRLWGLLLLTFHLMVWLLLGIVFAYQPLVIAPLFIWSPFAPMSHPKLAQILRQLPLFGDLAHLATVSLRRPRSLNTSWSK